MWWLMICAALAALVAPQEVVDATLNNAPSVISAEARVEAAKGARHQSTGPRYNPQVQVGLGVNGGRLEGQVIQPLSLTGEGMLDRRASGAELEAAEAALARERLEMAAAARLAYARLALALSSLRVAEKQLDGASTLRDTAKVRLDAGEAPELDVHLAKLEEARVVAIWLEAGNELVAARSELVALTGLSADIEVARDPIEAAMGLAGSVVTATRLDVVAAEADVAAAKAALGRERAAILPPVGIGAFYELDQGNVAAGPMITAQLPLWKQNQSGIGAARGDLMTAQAVLVTTQARAQVQIASTGERLMAADRAAALLSEDLTSAAASSLSALQLAYELGETDLNTTLLLQARVIEGERGWYAARASLAETRIRTALAAEDPSLSAAR
ncbi:MAG: cobalt-zinc-cadmium efflux system outer membrane protein [Kiritimatiellia bacterium]|jgi:cobalt-zinc-cadmium efflux system outer membrane protein